MKTFLMLFLFLAFSISQRVCASVPLAEMSLKTIEEDQQKIAIAKSECEILKDYYAVANLTIQCLDNAFYFEANTLPKAVQTTGTVRIANYNFLHPGTSKTMFKDYNLVARMLNHFDLISANELLGLVGGDVAFNKNLIKFVTTGPALLQKFQTELKNATGVRAKELNLKIKKLKNDLALAPKLYRVPGYVKVLNELRALDASWSLVISSRGDSALLGSVEEYVGFFYRKSRVDLTANTYCSKNQNSLRNEACLITMRDEFSQKNSATFFSRRPMIAKFISGNMKFNYITSHVVFNSFGDEERMNELLSATFGTNVFEEIGSGINEVNYARWIEVQLMAKWMGNFKKRYPQEKLLYGGDTNLVGSLGLWQKVLNGYAIDAILANTDKTTLTTRRYNNKNEETLGLANDYDHFIYKSADFTQCKVAKAYNFLTNATGTLLKNKYMIRDEANLLIEKSYYLSKNFKGAIEPSADDDGSDTDTETDIELDYRLTKQNEKKMNALLDDYRASLATDYQFKNNELFLDEDKIEEKVEAYKVRVFIKQLTNLNFYKVYQEIISDHLPISMDCTLN